MAATAPDSPKVNEPLKVQAILLNGQSPLNGAALEGAALPIIKQLDDRLIAYTLLSQSPRPNGGTRFVYRASLQHRGGPARFISARLLSATNANILIDGIQVLGFGPVSGNQTLTTTDSFEISTKNGNLPALGTLIWEIEAELSPVSFQMGDGGSFDGLAGDGVYTGSFTPAAEGRYLIRMIATGASPVPWERDAVTETTTVAQTLQYQAISDRWVDDDGDGLFDRLAVTINLSTTLASSYLAHLTYQSPNGKTTFLRQTQFLSLGAGVFELSIEAKRIAEAMQQDGPYQRLRLEILRVDNQGGQTAMLALDNLGATPVVTLAQLNTGPFRLGTNLSAIDVSRSGSSGFDFLQVDLPISSPGGECNWRAVLRPVGQSLDSYPVATGFGTLPKGASTLRFEFSGAKIRQVGISSPLQLAAIDLECGGTSQRIAESAAINGFSAAQFVQVAPSFDFQLAANTIALVPGARGSLRTSLLGSETVTAAGILMMTGMPSGIRFASVSPTSMSMAVPKEDYPLTIATDSNLQLGSYTGSLTAKAGDFTKTLPLTVNIVPAPITLALNLSEAALGGGQSITPVATVSGGSDIVWSVVPAVGTLSPTGTYTAPATIASRQTVRLIATAALDNRVTATVRIQLVPPGTVTLVPDTLVLHPSQSRYVGPTISNLTDQRFTWSISAPIATLEPFQNRDVNVIAPPVISQPAQATIRATYVPNPSLGADLPLQLMPAIQFSLSVDDPILNPGDIRQLNIRISNAVDNSIKWVLDPPIGIITPEGEYTAPSTLTASTSVLIRGFSVEDPSVQSSVNLILNAGVTNTPPAPWTSSLIGGAGPAGAVVAFGTGGFQLGASGCCWQSNSDAGVLLRRPVSGDSILTARFTGAGLPIDTRRKSIAGLQFRDGISPTAVYGGVFIERESTGANRWGLAFRLGAGLSTGFPDTYLPGALPDWIKLVRSGNTITAFYSSDNRNWLRMSLPVTIPMPATADAALFASNGTASVDAFSIRTTPDFLPACDAPSQAAARGRTLSFDLDAHRLLGHSGTFSFAVSGVPAGANAIFLPPDPSIGGIGRLEVNTGTAPDGAYPLVVTLTSGALSKQLNLTMTVASDFALQFQPKVLRANSNDNSRFDIRLSKPSGDTSPIALSGLPNSDFRYTRLEINPSSMANEGALASVEAITAGGNWIAGNAILRGSSSASTRRFLLPVRLKPVFFLSDPVSVIVASGGSAEFSITATNSIPGATVFETQGLPQGASIIPLQRSDSASSSTQRFRLSIPAGTPAASLTIVLQASQDGSISQLSIPVSITQ
ncbi:MAG: DUF1349 domain-containing protein [Acidobacteria bacterium]|nr:DUF1349 domain-containing protein [Acidobacteriota bacterium]